jgi:hypothetical protein
MSKGRVGEDRGSKETNRCPLTSGSLRLLVEFLLHLLEPFIIYGRRVNDFRRLLRRGNRG